MEKILNVVSWFKNRPVLLLLVGQLIQEIAKPSKESPVLITEDK